MQPPEPPNLTGAVHVESRSMASPPLNAHFWQNIVIYGLKDEVGFGCDLFMTYKCHSEARHSSVRLEWLESAGSEPVESEIQGSRIHGYRGSMYS